MNARLNYLMAQERRCDLIEEAERARLEHRYEPAGSPARRRRRVAETAMPHRGSNRGGH